MPMSSFLLNTFLDIAPKSINDKLLGTQRFLYHRWLGKPGMLRMQKYLSSEGDKITVFCSVGWGLIWLVTWWHFGYLWRQNSSTVCYECIFHVILQNVYPSLFLPYLSVNITHHYGGSHIYFIACWVPYHVVHRPH